MRKPNARVLVFLLALIAPALVAGASQFRLRRPLTVDHDDQPIQRPAARESSVTFAILNNTWMRHFNAEKVLSRKVRALNVNAFDEVPDSSWFTNRMGKRAASLNDIVNGIEGKPPAAPPWRVTKWNDEGYTPKVNIDASGVPYVLKFDPRGARERNSGAERIGTLIFYAAGYNVPHNDIVYFRPDDLNLAGAYYLDHREGIKRPLTRAYIDDVLKDIESMPDGPNRGAYRGIASQRLQNGLGPFIFHGVREDDANDRVPHELRRELRGLRVIGSWVNHVDIKDAQALDTYQDTGSGRGFVKHYLLDFSATLGAYEWPSSPFRVGHEYMFDGHTMSRSLLTLGLWRPAWQTHGEVVHPEIGYFSDESFEPAKWKPSFPNLAFEEMDDGDAYWGAKIVTAFSDSLIHQIAEAGEYSRPEVISYLENVLKRRRDAIGAYWLNRVTPLEAVTLTNSGASAGLTFNDLAVDRGYAEAATRSYRFWIEDFKGRKLTKVQTSNGSRPELELTGLADAISKVPVPPADEYGRVPLVRIVIQSTSGAKVWAKPQEVFVGRKDAAALQVLGWTHAF